MLQWNRRYRPAACKADAPKTVLWCNGNTSDSGPEIPGSSPGRTTQLTEYRHKPTVAANPPPCKMNIPVPISISDSFREYLSHDASVWELFYFNLLNGGYLVIAKRRIAQGSLSKQEQLKYEKEYSMCLTLAQNGYRVKFLKIKNNRFDIYLDGSRADLKKTASHNNVSRYAKKAIRSQGAQLVVFEFESITGLIRDELNKLKSQGIRIKYFTSDEKIVFDL